VKNVFKVIAGRAGGEKYVADSKSPIEHTPDDLRHIRQHLWDQVQYGYLEDGISTVTPDEMLHGMILNTKKIIMDSIASVMAAKRLVKDGFFNPMTGIGTSEDPGRYNFATSPVIMSPNEASAFYANGGIPQIIIDKKAKGVLLSGYSYEGNRWGPDEVKRLVDYGELLGVRECYVAAMRDGLNFGGSFAYPALKRDNAYTTGMDLGELLTTKDEHGKPLIEKDCIDHFAVADRWNCVLVPNWDVTARDYLYPRSIYVPIGGVRVATARGAVIRPKMLPYWDAIRQIGWTTPDFEGYIRPLKAYEIIIASIPIMAQQMSLLVHTMPLDSVIFQDGVERANEIMQANQKSLASWSMAQPRAVNNFGELKAIERHYEGFNDLVIVSRQHVAASCGIPESVLFHTQPTGFSDNKEDVLLKQSETIRLIGNEVKPQFAPLVRMLALSCFGPDYVDAQGVKIMDKLANLNVLFEVPIVQSAEKKAEAGTKFSTCIQTLTNSGVPLNAAFGITKLFFPDIEIPTEVMNQVNAVGGLYGAPGAVTPGGGMRELMRLYPEAAARIQEIMQNGRAA
jgi:hypothetical protein